MQETNSLRMLENLIYTDRMSTMLICINGYKRNSLYGFIVNLYLKSSVPFEGLDQLILKLDQICEVLGEPKITMSPRFFHNSMGDDYMSLSYKGSKDIIKAARFRKDLGGFRKQTMEAKQIFVVKIMFRYHATMQGKVCCDMTKGKYISFRSALELMRMLEQAGRALWGTVAQKESVKHELIRYIESVG